MSEWRLDLKLDQWENPVLIGETLPAPGAHVIIRIENQKIVILPVFETDRLPGDVSYIWPRKGREEAAKLAWKHLETRMRQARITHNYPCCGGAAIFFPTWLSLALNDYVTLAEERVCPTCHRHWTVEATVKDAAVDEVVWLYRSVKTRHNGGVRRA